jgi:hypothetical protein
MVMMVRQMLLLLLLLKKALSRHTPRAGPGLSQAVLTRPPGLFSRRGTEPRNLRESSACISRTRPGRLVTLAADGTLDAPRLHRRVA